MDWFLYDNGPRHERVKLAQYSLHAIQEVLLTNKSINKSHVYDSKDIFSRFFENLYVLSWNSL